MQINHFYYNHNNLTKKQSKIFFGNDDPTPQPSDTNDITLTRRQALLGGVGLFSIGSFIGTNATEFKRKSDAVNTFAFVDNLMARDSKNNEVRSMILYNGLFYGDEHVRSFATSGIPFMTNSNAQKATIFLYPMRDGSKLVYDTAKAKFRAFANNLSNDEAELKDLIRQVLRYAPDSSLLDIYRARSYSRQYNYAEDKLKDFAKGK